MKPKNTASRPNRRLFIASGSALVVGAAAISLLPGESFAGASISPVVAHRQAVDGLITLVDIRRPDEWAATGSGEGAHRLDMRRRDFMDALDQLVDGDRAKPIAVICARGVRSDRMSLRLVEAGFTNIIDVPEGMLGSPAGPGWLKRGLPVQK